MQADVKTKEGIADELLEHEHELMVCALLVQTKQIISFLQNVKYGIIVARNCKLDYFKRKRGDW